MIYISSSNPSNLRPLLEHITVLIEVKAVADRRAMKSKSVWLGKDLSAIVRLLLGGELTEYTQMMGSAQSSAAERMTAMAAGIGADAVINVRYMTTSVVGTAAELLVYGTAVKLR
jgi:uncharacterized protein YbjQ (UPF0145 family)